MIYRDKSCLASRIPRLVALPLFALGIILGAGCATTFVGDAHFGGPRKCFKECRRQNMNMAGYVYLGRYSSACICEVKGGGTRRRAVINSSTGAVGGTAAGVIMQMRRAAAAQANR